MNHLEGLIGYLAGPIEMVEEGGVKWRETFKKLISDKEIPLSFLDPTNKPKSINNDSVHTEKDMYEMFTNKNDYEGKHFYIKNNIIKPDLRMVDKSDFIIALVDKDTPSFGTTHEIINASNQNKPVLIYSPKGFNSIPGWICGLIHPKYYFTSIYDIAYYLVKLNRDGNFDNKWIVIK